MSKSAQHISSEMVHQLKIKLSETPLLSNVTRGHIQKDIKSLEDSNASSGWVRNYMKRNGFVSKKDADLVGHIKARTLLNARDEFKRSMCKMSIEDICNTDETAVLFRSFPSHAIRSRAQPSNHERVNDRLTAVLTVFADGTKMTLTIKGTAHRPRSFPGHFDAMKDLGVFNRSPRNSWNSAHLWTRTVRGFNKSSEFESSGITPVIDNCSAHAIDYCQFGNYEAIVLPPNMTSVLQPVDAAIGISFKFGFWL